MATVKEGDNVIFVGSKPVMSYVMAVMTQFNSNIGSIKLKARGRSISRAVDVAEVVRNRFMNTSTVKSISIGTDKVTGERGESNVSTIEIEMLKNGVV